MTDIMRMIATDPHIDPDFARVIYPTSAEADEPVKPEPPYYRDFEELAEDDDGLAMRLVKQHVGMDILNLLVADPLASNEARKEALAILDKVATNYVKG